LLSGIKPKWRSGMEGGGGLARCAERQGGMQV
jgi:hypothetical protein